VNQIIRTKRLALFAAALSVALLVLVPTALAGKGGGAGHKPGGGGSGGSSSFTLVPLNSTDGLPHWGQQITFNVTTTATTEPHVSIACYQNGVMVATTQTGYYASYPWPGTQNITLASGAWTGGAADCNARLYSLSNSGGSTTLGTMSFHVYA
jgi:hypothetical protein